MADTMASITESIMATMENKATTKKKIFRILAVVFGVVFLACVSWLAAYYVQNQRAEKQIEKLREEMQDGIVPGGETPSEDKALSGGETVSTGESDPAQEVSRYAGLDGYDVPAMEIDFEKLQAEENEDIYAWITVPGTVIDYPVLQHPEEIGYYLKHNLDHSKGYPGCIYSQLYSSKDWEDPITCLYGHNMKNGTMFAGLHQYRDSEFFREHPYVYIYTPDKIRVYEIFAAYEYTDVDLVLMYHYGGEETYKAYLESIYTLDGMNNNFNTEIEVTAEDKILTLVTCISDKPDRRYLVQSVLVAEGSAQ